MAIPSIWPNIHHAWQRIVEGALFHKGLPEWPGSAACFTAPDPDYSNTMNLIRVGEIVIVRLRGPKLALGLYTI
jgi:hypothetical protein